MVVDEPEDQDQDRPDDQGAASAPEPPHDGRKAPSSIGISICPGLVRAWFLEGRGELSS